MLFALGCASAQCVRPLVPHGGFGTEMLAHESVTYTDGVVAEGRLILPTIPAPSCGWPLVVRVHSLGANREQDVDHQRELASEGYAVWAYDVRGQGATRFLNQTVGTTLYGPMERFDLAEQIAHVRSVHAGVVSAERVAVIGVSQGGAHSWIAASQSGHTITVAGRGTIVFPVVSCVVGSDYVAEPTRHRVRGGTLFNSIAIDTATLDPLTQLYGVDQGLATAVRQFFLAQDPAGLVQYYRNEPERIIEDGLATSDVPVLFFHAWHDAIAGVDLVLDGLHRLPPTTPWRLLASTLGHGVPFNAAELRFRNELEQRWLARFLWSEPNGIESEPHVVAGAMPLDPSSASAATTLWRHSFDEDLPSAAEHLRRWFTTESGTLDENEPVLPGAVTRIEHTVPSGYDAAAWLADPGSHTAANVLAAIPLSARSFDVDLTEATYLLGSTHLHARVIPHGPRFTLAALLSVRLPGTNDFVMLSHGGRGVLDATPETALDVDVALSAISAHLPAGSTLRLSLRNLWLTEPPHLVGVIAVPMFESVAFDIEHGSGTDATWVDLPLRTASEVTLESDRLALDVTAPSDIAFHLQTDQGRAGWRYLLVASGSGQTPATPVFDGSLPLVIDGMTIAFGMMVGSPELVDFSGTLDAAGTAVAHLDLRGIPSLPLDLAGIRLTFAAWVYRGETDFRGAGSTPVDLFLR